MNKYSLIALFSLFAAVLIMCAMAVGILDVRGALSLAICVITCDVILLNSVASSGDRVDISLSNLSGLYGCVFGFYYISALVFYISHPELPQDNTIEMALLILVGYLSFQCGVHLLGNRNSSIRQHAFTAREQSSLLILCWFGFGAVLLGDAYSIATGLFFTHGGNRVVAATLRESILGQMTIPFETPILMISALLSGISASAKTRRASKISFRVFIIILCSADMLSGQFLQIVNFMICSCSVLSSVKGFRLSWRRLVSWAAVGMFALFLIEVARSASALRGSGSAGPAEAFSLIVDGVQRVVDGSAGLPTTQVSDRAVSDVNLLSIIIERVKYGAPYVYGPIVADTLRDEIPRLFWRDKPAIISPQRQIRFAYGLPNQDDACGPLIADFALSGFWGVLGGMFLLGVLLSWLRSSMARSSHVLPTMLFFWVLGSALFIEEDQIQSMAGAIRHCLVAWLLFRMILFFMPKNIPSLNTEQSLGELGGALQVQ